jgi:hypothetical protein
MLTKAEAAELEKAARFAHYEGMVDLGRMQKMLASIDRETDKYAPNDGTDVIAAGPQISTRQMLDEAARAFGWRTDWACGDSPITWELVLEEIKKLRK